MAKMVGMNVVIKQGWTKKAVALLDEQLAILKVWKGCRQKVERWPLNIPTSWQ